MTAHDVELVATLIHNAAYKRLLEELATQEEELLYQLFNAKHPRVERKMLNFWRIFKGILNFLRTTPEHCDSLLKSDPEQHQQDVAEEVTHLNTTEYEEAKAQAQEYAKLHLEWLAAQSKKEEGV